MKRHGAPDLHKVMLELKAQQRTLSATYFRWVSTARVCSFISDFRPSATYGDRVKDVIRGERCSLAGKTGEYCSRCTPRSPARIVRFRRPLVTGVMYFAETLSERSQHSQCVSRRCLMLFSGDAHSDRPPLRTICKTTNPAIAHQYLRV